jgi:photosystem II stability/assembly factor-like uncharacterized protein
MRQLSWVVFILCCWTPPTPAQPTWVYKGNLGSGPINALISKSADGIFAGTDQGGIFVSTDFGESWTQRNSGLPLFYIRSLALDSSGILYAGTQGAGILLSSNSGNQWVATTMSVDHTVRAIGTSPSGIIFAGTSGGGAFRSTGSGGTWLPVTNGLTDPFVRFFAVRSPEIFAGTGFAGVFRSTNNGDSWTISLSSDWDYRALTFDHEGNIFAGGWGGGVLRSTNGGDVWENVNVGLTNRIVEWLIAEGSLLFAATRGGGVFVSSNQGTLWVEARQGMTNLDIRSLAIDDAGYLYAGSGMGDVFRTSSPITGIHEEPRHTSFSLEHNFPNPFNSSTTIRFTLAATEDVRLTVFTLLGEEIATLIDERMVQGGHTFSFEAGDIASGVYFYHLSAGQFRTTRRLMIIR